MILNLSEPYEFDYELIKPDDFVVFCAAISSPDKCRSDYSNAYATNIEGPKFVITKFLERRARVVFCSSDAVYGETKQIEAYEKYSRDRFDKNGNIENGSNLLNASLVASNYDEMINANNEQRPKSNHN